MKKRVFVVMLGVVAVLLMSGCGDKNSHGSQNSDNGYVETVVLKSDAGSDVVINAKGSDKLKLSIPPLGSDANDSKVAIEVTYKNNLPQISISDDINFSSPVTLSFTSESLIDENVTLVYYVEDKKYYVLSSITNHTLTAKLQHFSIYGIDFVPQPSEKLREDIGSRLTAYKQRAENSKIDKFSYDELNDLFVKISVFKGTDDFDGMLNDLAYIIEKSSYNTMQYYKNTQLNYFSGYCPTNILESAMKEIYSVYSWNQTLHDRYGSLLDGEDLSLDMEIEAKQMFEKVLDDSKEEWETNLNPKVMAPKCDAKLHEYIKCTRKYISITEFSIIYFPDSNNPWIATDEIEKEMEKAIDEDAQSSINDGDCKCMLFYQDILNTYFSKSLSSTINQLQDATKQCSDTRCPLLWDVTENVNGWYDWNPDWKASGTATWNNVYIDFYYDKSFFDLSEAQQKACEPYRDSSNVWDTGSEYTTTMVSGDYFDTSAGLGVYKLADDDGKEHVYLGIPPEYRNPFEDIQPKLVKFEQFTTSVDNNGHGTDTYTFTPHVPGFKFSGGH